jgi:chromosome segregation ATPase
MTAGASATGHTVCSSHPPADDAIVVVLRKERGMSEERFVQVEQRLDRVEQRLDRVEQRLDHVEQRLNHVEQRLDRVEQRLDRVEQKLDQVEQKVDRLAADVSTVAERLEDLHRHMLVLHEDVIDRIRAIGEHHTLRPEMQAEDKALRDTLTQHIALSDATDRRFVRRLDDHERRITFLERK